MTLDNKSLLEAYDELDDVVRKQQKRNDPNANLLEANNMHTPPITIVWH